jgi:hypothetical protein
MALRSFWIAAGAPARLGVARRCMSSTAQLQLERLEGELAGA